MMNPSSILVFFNPSVRATNDATNHLREIILETILTSPHVEDQDYGIRWRQVRDSWSMALHGITLSVYDRVQVTRKGGRRHNHDFTVEFYHDDRLVDTQQVEFKFGKSMKSLPQFLSMYSHFQMFPSTYAAFYYEHYLDHYLSYVGIEKPPLPEYLDHVYSTTSNHPFFSTLKEREVEHKKVKSEIVNDSIQAYLQTNATQIILPILYEKLQSSQQKTFLLWDETKFTAHRLTFEPLEYKGYTKNTILITSGVYTLKLLLRWKNHKGILGPAWQIKA
jgi:hypothetical protein